MLQCNSVEPEPQEEDIVTFNELAMLLGGNSNLIDKMDIYAEKYGHMTVSEMISEICKDNLEWYL